MTIDESRFFPKSQTILHDCLKILKNHNQRSVRYGKAVISVKGNTNMSKIIQIHLDGIGCVFEVQTMVTDKDIISFPNTRYATPNTHNQIVNGVFTLRRGLWIEKIAEYAKTLEDRLTVKTKDNFTTVDDAKLWEG